MKQKSIQKPIEFQGTGLHTGRLVHVRLLPADADTGIRFIRTDLPQSKPIPALAPNVGDTSRSTSVQCDGAAVGTIEHLMAAIAILGISNLTIETDGAEFPILDGCSQQLIGYLRQAGIREQETAAPYFILDRHLRLEMPNGSWIEAFSSDHFEMELTVDYHTKVLGRQTARLQNLEEAETAIAGCRTFCFLHEIWPLIQNNLIKGGSLDNAMVYVAQPLHEDEKQKIAEFFHLENIEVDESTGILSNTRLQFDNEAARHKLLDVLGDMQLIGMPLQAKIRAYCPGHAANTRFAQLIYNHLQAEPAHIHTF
ncbi:MAG: UDP-3-O-acyl-N-acetylglucosamine deacetylase [Bacteroidales bacterium]|nr:UDP-3-O-acyl-N-acetylglucosamine deacetylase [Bacteroidales bacterium]